MVAPQKRIHSHTEQATDIGRESIVIRALVLNHPLILGPGPEEERNHPVMKHIQESRQRRVGMVERSIPHVFGKMERHRPLRTQQPEEALLQTRKQGPTYIPLKSPAIMGIY